MEVLSRPQTRHFARKRTKPLEAVLDRISDGILATDLEGRVLFASLATRAVLGMG
jgi:PAS domain-containing protein